MTSRLSDTFASGFGAGRASDPLGESGSVLTARLGGPPRIAVSVVREETVPAKTVDYEVTYILRPHLEEADTEAQVSHIAEQLKTAGGEVSGDIDRLGKRRLAYEIGGVREGFYVVMRFKSEPPAAKELERLLRLNENVVRAILLRREEYSQPVQVPVPVAAPQETADIP